MTDEEAKALIAKGIRAIAENSANEDGEPTPFVTAWIIAYEIDSIDLARNNEGAGGVRAPDGQSTHLSRGLAATAFDFWGPAR